MKFVFVNYCCVMNHKLPKTQWPEITATSLFLDFAGQLSGLCWVWMILAGAAHMSAAGSGVSDLRWPHSHVWGLAGCWLLVGVDHMFLITQQASLGCSHDGRVPRPSVVIAFQACNLVLFVAFPLAKTSHRAKPREYWEGTTKER